FHPYPVTPYHWDYLHYFDRVAGAKTQSLQRSASDHDATTLHQRVRTRGQLAAQLVPSAWQMVGQEGEVTVEEIALVDLLSPHLTGLNGWLGPPWLKAGWFHAYLLLAETITDQ